MIPPKSRRGSALLIVLGMLSFMIVSAVAFSAFMRYSRLPSSYLRRSSASRLLAKAAMARAIDRVDMAVNNNPHPNQGWQAVQERSVKEGGRIVRKRLSLGNNRNLTENRWQSRILMATNDWSSIDFDDTVPTLTLEGLAYIPTPIVNDARYFSRRTRTAMWQPLNFDSGRYAFCAIDVSDCLDVNRLLADVPRTSAPNGRIRIGHIFEDKSHSSPPSGAADWDNFMNESFRVYNSNDMTMDFWSKSKPPLISLADFNLALGARGSIGNFKSQFCNYVKNNKLEFYERDYSTRLGDDIGLERIRNMMFVADGYYPPAENAAKNPFGDLNGGEAQPFKTSVLLQKGGNQIDRFYKLLANKGSGLMENEAVWRKWKQTICVAGMAALFDYLDDDHVPLSLSTPTVERVPMVCGIEPDITGSKFKVNVDKGKDEYPDGEGGPDATERVVKHTVTYTLDVASLQLRAVKSLLMFPFNHADDTDAGQFTIDGRFSLFLSKEEMMLRTNLASEKDNEILRIGSKNLPQSGLPNGVIAITIPDQSVSFSKVESEADAFKKVDSMIAMEKAKIAMPLKASPLLTVTYQWKQTRTIQQGGMGAVPSEWLPKFETVKGDPSLCEDNFPEYSSGFAFVKADGSDGKDDVLRDIKSGNSPRVYLNAAVWLRVRDGADVVDMAPACFADDIDQRAGNSRMIIAAGLLKDLSGNCPLMKFGTGVAFDFSPNNLDNFESSPIDMNISPKAVLVNDPRFNHAPENWFVYSGGLSENSYLDEMSKQNVLGVPERDGDIFMATSDAGYMQSVYELAFIPRFTQLDKTGNGSGNEIYGNMAPLGSANYQTFAGDFNGTYNKDSAWRTYSPYGDDYDAFLDLGLTCDGTGQKINPYSDSLPVLMSVFANTPIDWKRCSTNSTTSYSVGESAAQFNRKYAFNQYSNNKIEWEDLQAIAESFTNAVGTIVRNNNPEETWEDAWSNLDWGYDKLNPDNFLGMKLSNNDAKHRLWTVDRKFLYGYWHDCFAASQQLYLIFVRAEPMMMGGGEAGGIPPQLGARAMAVVWRDPTPSYASPGSGTLKPEYPHRTRILFYRQFE